MPRKPASELTFNNTELLKLLQNTLIAVGRPRSGEVGAVRKTRLTEFSMALLEPFDELVDEGLITMHDLVWVLQACATLVQKKLMEE
jgi:hypothetical protein